MRKKNIIIFTKISSSLLKSLLFLLCIFFNYTSYAQTSLRRIEDSIKALKKNAFLVQLDRKNTFIHKNHPIDINGILFAIQHRYKHQFGIGFYCLEPWTKPTITQQYSSLLGSYRESTKFNMYYTGFRYKYTFFQKGILSMGIPIETGFGFSHSKVVLLDYNISATAHAYFAPLEIGYYIRLRVTKWFAVFGSVGYRKTFALNILHKPGTTFDYNGLYYHYGVSIYFKNIIQDTKKHKKN
ncbi:MAG TPA: hypothetical protein VK766_01300 [Cytophagaceae bacterium]|jgi:hypothetical protein|nr:hypothetical protein [Cytophagaceae bacterium]